MNPLAERAELHHMAETREMPFTDAEVRMESAGGGMTFRGYASIFDSPYPIEDAYGEYHETVKRTAFDRSLAQGADVVFLINHSGAPLARTKSGTLALSTDPKGLLAAAKLDPNNPRAQEVKSMVERGDLDQMSFTFRDLLPTWNGDYTERSLKSVELNHGDVSAVNFAANPATAGTLAMRSRLAAARTELSSFDRDNLPDSAFAYIESGGHKDASGRTTPRALRHYPINDASHVRDALARIGGGAKFGKEALPKVLAAAKKFGIKTSEQNSLIAKGETRTPAFVGCNCCPPCPGAGCDGSCCDVCPADLLSDAVKAIQAATASDSMDAPSLEHLAAMNDLEVRSVILRHLRRAAEGPPLTKAEQATRDAAWADEIVERRRRQLARIQRGN
jgi:HK97 family phage prohead protease